MYLYNKTMSERFIFVSLLFLTMIRANAVEKHLGTSRTAKRFKYRNKYADSQDAKLFCKVSDVTGACLSSERCEQEGGRVVGFCKTRNNVCCNVVKSCNGESASHATTLKNPSFPDNDTRDTTCSLALQTGKDICAVRINYHVFEIASYYKDMCPVSTLIVLGTKETSSPQCGNLTNWSTTFEVEPQSKVTLAMILQGSHPYRFYVTLNMLACSAIVELQSPENAGMINTDAKKYVPTTTTTTAAPVTTNDSSAMDNAAATTPMESTTLNSTREDNTSAQTTSETISSTTPTPNVVEKVDGKENEEQDKNEDENEVNKKKRFSRVKQIPFEARSLESSNILEPVRGIKQYFDPTPDSSFKRIFRKRALDQCQINDNIEDENEQTVPKLPNAARSNFDEDCWYYDPTSNSYRANENCKLNPESNVYEPSFRVIGGKHTKISEYPWQVGVLSGKNFFCGGALISDRFVLTASHCVFGSFKSGIHTLRVTLGDHDLRIDDEVESVTRAVKSVIPNLHFGAKETDNDIALLELSESVEFSRGINPVNLPINAESTYSGQNATITGWGRYSLKSRKTSPIMKKYTSVIDDIDHCVKRWETYPKISAKKGMHLCLNITYGSPCHGDSGGPLVLCSESSRCTLIGVVSFGFPLCRDVGLPAVFTRVPSYKPWIDINTSPLPMDELY